MSVLAPTAVDSRRPIQIHTYGPTLPGTNPRFPDALIEMFLRVLTDEPHKNNFYCDTCGRSYTIAAQVGKSCTRPQESGVICYGKVTRRWTMEKVEIELCRLMAQGGVAIAWELGESSIPVAIAVCEAHHSDTVIAAVDFPMNVLGNIYGRLGHTEPFLVFTHVSLEGITDVQRPPVVEKLVKDAAESTMSRLGLSQAGILIPVSRQVHFKERQALDTMLQGKQILIANDLHSERQRELWGFKLRIR